VHEVETMHVAVQSLAPGIAALVRPENGRKFLDVAGGSGAFTVAFLERNRALIGTILERAEFIEVTRRHLNEAGYESCVRLIASDFVSSPWPDEQDLVFLSAILHKHSPPQCQTMFRHAFTCLNPGGRIVIRDHIMSEDRLLPRAGALCGVHMLVSAKAGRPYTFSELREWLQAEGFRDVRVLQDGERTNGIVEAFKPSSPP
jgi:ubiquinone/menaquinone biosynthesis C-methylase UbiE